MKFLSVSLLLAAVSSVVSAAPAGNSTSVDYAAILAGIAEAAGPEDGQRQCASNSKGAGSVANAEIIVNYLRSLPPKQACVTTFKSGSGEHVGLYYANGNVEFVGVVSNKKCSEVSVNCHTLSNYFQSLINTCKLAGKIEAAQYLNPNQFTFTNPKLCKKTDKEFVIGIIPYNHTTSH